MEMKQVSDNCFAVLNEKNRVCDANSGLINRGGGVVIDTQSDLAPRTADDRDVQQGMARDGERVINTHEDAEHVWGNQLFEGRRWSPTARCPTDEEGRRAEGEPETAARRRPLLSPSWCSRRSTPALWPPGSNCWRIMTLTGSSSSFPRPCSTHDTSWTSTVPRSTLSTSGRAIRSGTRSFTSRGSGWCSPGTCCSGNVPRWDGRGRTGSCSMPRPDHSNSARKSSSPATARYAGSTGPLR